VPAPSPFIDKLYAFYTGKVGLKKILNQ